MKKTRKIITIIMLILISATLATAVYLCGSGAFGVYDRKEAESTYENRADNYYGGRFHNEEELSDDRIDETDYYKSSTTGKSTVPEETLPLMNPSYGNCSEDDVEITWYGHSTLLLRMHGMNILIDPVFSDYVGINKMLGTPRFGSITSYEKSLPHIDICILTHDHFDHLDYQSIVELDDNIDSYIAPLGTDKRLERFGVSPDKITDIAWWEEQDIDGLHIACTPAQHSSGRILVDKRKTLWCSYVFFDENNKIFLTGDTGFGSHFKKIHDKYGDVDLMLTDGAQYGGKKDQHVNHMYPEEAAEAVSIMNADKAMLIHWGSFNLSNYHAWDDPPSRFAIACRKQGIDNITPMIGQTFLLDNTKALHNHWWESLK